jgi:hypothetical protein
VFWRLSVGVGGSLKFKRIVALGGSIDQRETRVLLWRRQHASAQSLLSPTPYVEVKRVDALQLPASFEERRLQAWSSVAVRWGDAMINSSLMHHDILAWWLVN